MSFPCPSCHYIATSKSGQLAHQRVHTDKKAKGTIEQKNSVVLSDSGTQVYRCGGCKHEVKYYASHLKHVANCPGHQASLKKRELKSTDVSTSETIPKSATRESIKQLAQAKPPRQDQLNKPSNSIQPVKTINPIQPIKIEPLKPANPIVLTNSETIHPPAPTVSVPPLLEVKTLREKEQEVPVPDERPLKRHMCVIDPDLSYPPMRTLDDLVPFKGVPIFSDTLDWIKSYLSRYDQ